MMLLNALMMTVLNVHLSFVFGNTEIKNFRASSRMTRLPNNFASNLHALNSTQNEQLFRVLPASLSDLLTHVCEGDQHYDRRCQNELWVILDLDDINWKQHSWYTVRVSWPASYPTSFEIEIFSPAKSSTHLGVGGADVTSTVTISRKKYARVHLIDSSVSTPTLWVDREQELIPFNLIVEPLYFNVVPSSVVPSLAFLLPLLGSAFWISQHITWMLNSIADDACQELRGVKLE